MAFNSKRSKFIIVALIAMLLFGNTLPKGAKAEELFQEESFSDIEETDPTPSPSAVSQTTPSAAPVSLQDEQLSEETPVPQASAGQTEKPTEATPAPTPSPSATQKPETTKTPEASATPLAKKDSFQSGYAEILKGTEVYSDEELYGNSLLGRFTESSSLVYVIERYGDGSSDKEVVLIAFAAMESDELTAQFAYTRVRNLKPIDPKKEKNVKRLISDGAYVYFDEEKEYPVGKCAFEFAASLEEPEILEEETLSEEEILSEEQGLFDQEISAEESVISEEAKDSSDPVNSGTDATVEEGDTAPESDSVVSEVLGEAQKQIDMSATQESVEKTDSLFEERQSEDTLADPISAKSEERTEAAITEDTPDEEVETWTSDAITEIIPSDNAALDDQPEAEKEETESSEVVIDPIPSNEAVSDDQNPEENLANDEKGEAALSNQENSTEESQAESDDSVQAVSSEKKAEEEELLEEEVLFGGEYAERASEEMKAEETLIEEALTDDSVVVELNAADNSDSGREPKPVSFTPRVALMGEGQTRSFTLSADSYNPEGAELGEVTKVTVEGGEEAAFSDIEFTEAGTYGFAIMDDAQEEYPWELTVVVDENVDLEQLYVDSTKTVYSRGTDTGSANNEKAEFISKNGEDESEEDPLDSIGIRIGVKKRIIGHEYNGKQYYLSFDIENAFEFILSPINGSPMPANNKLVAGEITAGNDESNLASFDEIRIDKAGEYKYSIKETNKSENFPYFVFDEAEHEVTVIVIENAGKLEASIDYGTPEADCLVIENKYDAYDLQVLCKSIGGVDHDEFDIAISYYDGNEILNPYTFIVMKEDATEVKSDIITSGKKVTLKNGEKFIIPALPKGTNYRVEGTEKEGYRTAYDANRNGSNLQDNKITVVTFADENLSCALELQARVQLYGHNESGKYYYPGITTVFPLQLEAITPKAPMPGGATSPYIVRGWGFPALKGTGNQYRSILGSFGEIVFTEDDLLINPSGIFEYKITRNKDEEYSFIEYDFRDNYKAPEYTITVEVKKVDGKLVANYKESIPLFRHRFDATRMRIVKRVQGKGASSSIKFPVTLTLLEQRANEDTKVKAIPVKNWVFVAAIGRVIGDDDYRISKTVTYTTNSSGTISLNLGHRDFVILYNLPKDKYYEISENEISTTRNYYPSYTVRTTEVDDEKSTSKASRIGKTDTDKYYYAFITNTYSEIPLTGYCDPTLKSLILAGCLLLAVSCAYARRKLQ